jgi:hypothetical protein
MTEETGKQPNGAAAAILAPFPSRVSTRMPIQRGVVCGSFAAADTSYVIVRASLGFCPTEIELSAFDINWYSYPPSKQLGQVG